LIKKEPKEYEIM